MNKVLILVVGTAMVLCAVSLANTTLILDPTDDATVDNYYDGMNYGSDAFLRIQGYYDDRNSLESVQESFLKFNLSTIPDNAEIISARLYICVESFSSGILSTPTSSLHYVGDDTWAEGTISWNNAPAYNPGYIDDQLAIGGTGYISWDLASNSGEFAWDYTQDLNDDYISVLLKTVDEDINNFAQFYSYEFENCQLRPYLEITYSIIPAPGAICLACIGVVFVRRLRISL